MKFGAKRTTPVVWTDNQFKFWHGVSTLQATAPQPGPLDNYLKTKEDFLYDTKSSWGLKSRFGEGWFSTLLEPLLLIFSKGNGPKWSIWPTTGPFHSIFIAMIYICQKNIFDILMVQIGADIGEIWRIGNEMLGARHGQ